VRRGPRGQGASGWWCTRCGGQRCRGGTRAGPPRERESHGNCSGQVGLKIG
jgi:hypothetical protein